MNKNRRPLAQGVRKKVEKEIKGAQAKLAQPKLPPHTDTLTVEEELQKFPLKKRKLEESLVEAVKKSIAVKKAKKATKHSKRSTPGEVNHRESPPASIHTESTRWQKTLTKQAQSKGKKFTTKLQKRRDPRK